MNNMNYSIEQRIYHRRGRNAGFNTRVVCYIIVRHVKAIGWTALMDARGNARKFKTPEAAETAAKEWFAAECVAA